MKNKKLINDIKNNYFNENAFFFAKKYNVSTNYIYCLASKLKITTKHRLKAEEEKIVKAYKNGDSIKTLKKKFGHDNKSLIKLLKENNCILRNRRTSHVKFKFNESYFEKIDTHEKAYWLGFIYSDGNIHENKLQIGLHKKDILVLKEFKKNIKSEHKLYKDGDSWKFIVRSQKICDDLANLGVFPKKSLNLLPPNNCVPEEFVNSFLLGYFDGDGCIRMDKKTNHKGHKIKTWRFQLVSTKEFLIYVKNIFDKVLNRNANIYKEKRRNGNTWYLVYSGSCMGERGKQTPRKILKYLYSAPIFSLKRKKDIFIKIC